MRLLAGTDVEVTLHEGRKRQVRRMFASAGYVVEELARVRQGPLALGSLKPGAWRVLTAAEVAALEGCAEAPCRRGSR